MALKLFTVRTKELFAYFRMACALTLTLAPALLQKLYYELSGWVS